MPHRQPFNIKKPLVAAREFVFAGETFKKGDPFPVKDFSPRLIKRQYEAHAINHTDDGKPAPEAGAVPQMLGPKGGRYTITAPWFDEAEVIRGKQNAEDRFAQVQADGPPLGWIAGGSEVTVEGGEGGWYVVQAPWLDEEEKVQGREAAETRQRELHEAGAPEGWEPASDEGDGEGDDEDEDEGADDGKGAEDTPGTAPAKAKAEVEAAAGEGGPDKPASE